MRRVTKPYKWSPEVVDMLYSHWGLRSAAGVASMLTRQFGKTFTRAAVLRKANELDLTVSTAQHYVSIVDAARVLGLPYSTLLNHCKRQGLRLLGTRAMRFLPDDTWCQVQAYYAPPPEPCVGVSEAARRLICTPSAIQQAVKRGTMPHYRHGGCLRIPVAVIERRERAMRGARYIGEAIVKRAVPDPVTEWRA